MAGSPLRAPYTGRKQAKTILLEYVDLSGIDLIAGNPMTSLALNPEILADQVGKNWKQMRIRLIVCDDQNGNGKCTDEPKRNQLSVSPMTFLAKHIPESMKLTVWSGRHLTLAADAELCEAQYSPIILDLNNDGFNLSGPEAGTVFDLNDTGSPIYTGWVNSKDDVFVVRDINGNGIIDSGAELFGSATFLADGQRAENGFVALSEFDTDSDGQISPADRDWGSLQLWSDRNFNGYSDPNELMPMKRFGIEQISLQYVEVQEIDRFGNETRQRSTFSRLKFGKSLNSLVADIWFNTLVE